MYDRIVKHMMKYGTITSIEAIEKYGCTRISHYIYLMRKNGYNVTSEVKKGTNRYGQKSHYSLYKLVNSNG
jgi:hypothetical protein